MSPNNAVSWGLVVAGAIILGKATHQRYTELNRKLPLLEALNENLKKFAKEKQMQIMRNQIYKEVKENLNKHSKSSLGYITGFSLLAAGATIAFANSRNNTYRQNKWEEQIPQTSNISDKVKGAVEVGAIGYALGFAVGVAGTGLYNMVKGDNINADTIFDATHNGHVAGLAIAAIGVSAGALYGLNEGLGALAKDKPSFIDSNFVSIPKSYNENLLSQRRDKRDKGNIIEI